MESSLLLKNKRYVSVKGWTCAYGNKKWVKSKNKEVTSPSVSLELVLITATIDPQEKWDVSIIDVPGELPTYDMNEEVLMVTKGRLGELMFKTDLSIYHKCVIIENMHTTLYVHLHKSLYGCLRRKFIFYENLVR